MFVGISIWCLALSALSFTRQIIKGIKSCEASNDCILGAVQSIVTSMTNIKYESRELYVFKTLLISMALDDEIYSNLNERVWKVA